MDFPREQGVPAAQMNKKEVSISKSIQRVFVLLTWSAVGLYLWYQGQELVEVFLKLRVSQLLTLIFLALLRVLVASIRLLGILRCYHLRLSFNEGVRLFVVGRLWNLLLPQSGNVFRATYLKTNHGVQYREFLSLLTAYSLMSVAATLVGCLALVSGGSALSFDVQGQIRTPAIGILGLVIAGMMALMMSAKYGKWAKAFADRTLGLLLDRRVIFLFLTTTLVLFLIDYFLFRVAFLGFSISVDWSCIVLLVSALELNSVVSVTPGNIGLFEATLGFILADEGRSVVLGVAIATLLRLSSTSAIILLSLFTYGFGDSAKRVDPKLHESSS